VIGAFDKLPEIKEEIIKLSGPSLILTFTDGLTELKNNNGEFFDDEKILKFVSDNKNLSVSQFNTNLLEEIDKFKETEDYTDDIAILTCKIK
jgi:sigma-B regulation protein RsbU (phosphoserine phosphatase)